ncbi:MAG: RNA polymerase sigma factor, partial [Acidobacteria bacterium]|nr:RNA polymerase sigma factor [Acidobacteriota bacterium]
ERNGFKPSMNTENCLDSQVLSLKQERMTIDQKIAELFEQMRDSVYHYLLVAFGNPAEAEEITQEAFLRLLRHLQSGGVEDSNVRSWIFRVAHNLAVDQQRGRKYEALLDFDGWEQFYQSHLDPSPDPERRVLQQESFKKLQAALSRLSPQQRQCLMLKAEGFRYEQIAKILRISPSNVAQSLRRGIKKVVEDNHA